MTLASRHLDAAQQKSPGGGPGLFWGSYDLLDDVRGIALTVVTHPEQGDDQHDERECEGRD